MYVAWALSLVDASRAYMKRLTHPPANSRSMCLPGVSSKANTSLPAYFASDSVAVQGFPSFLSAVAPAAFLSDVLDLLGEEDPSLGPERLLDGLLAMMACKAAVKAGDTLSRSEIDALLARRHEVDKVTSCPHGRPTEIRLTLKDLEKRFKRS